MRFYLILLMLMMVAGVADARPGKRFDAATKSCRLLGFDANWWGSGNKIFQQKCKTCHSRASEKGAPFLHAESKTPRGWNRVFARRYPDCAQNGKWQDLTINEQLALNDFLYKNGSGSYNAYDADDCG